MGEFKIAQKSELRENAVLSRLTPFGRIGLTMSDGEILAFQDVCTHDGSPFDDGDIEHGEITCPRHGARFALRTGQVLEPPAMQDIEVYPVRIDGEDIYVRMD